MSDNAYEKMVIQWFPGHMTKAQRMIEENMKMVDAVCELLDARIPFSSRNPDIDRLAGDKPRLVILNRIDLADPAITAKWRAYFQKKGLAVLETDAKSGKGVNNFTAGDPSLTLRMTWGFPSSDLAYARPPSPPGGRLGLCEIGGGHWPPHS